MRMVKVIRALTRRKDHLKSRLDSWVGEKNGSYFYLDAERSALEEALLLCEAEDTRRMVQQMTRNGATA